MAWKDYNYVGAIAEGSIAAAATFFVFPVITSAGLSVLGFTSTGIAAGSFAAGAQASIGNVVANSWFAYLTSWGMTTTSITASATAGATAGGVVTFLKRQR
mmetsp:Transcript_124060/g.243365  ORF Transcript_124060/g.243365 Transcript_124060/m.243365 type:complete len:101 (-) Transcript_124060:96-398(-)